MAALLASLITFILLIAWGAIHFTVWELPQKLYQWISRHPWGQDPWWESVVRWFTVPLAWIAIFGVLWMLLVLLLGRPAGVLRKHGLDTREAGTGRPGSFRSRFWQRLFRLACPGFAGRRAAPFTCLAYLCWAGVAMSIVAAFPLGVLLRLLPFVGHPVYPWVERPSIAIVLFLVAFSARLAERSCRRIALASVADEGPSLIGSDPVEGGESPLSEIRKELTEGAALVTQDPVIPTASATHGEKKG